MLLLFLTISFNVFAVDNSNTRMKALSQAKILFANEQYDQCIKILEPIFLEENINEPWSVNSVVIEGRNLLADCYLKKKQYYKAYLEYNFTAGYTYEEYSLYKNDSFWLIKTIANRDYKDYIPFPNDYIEFDTEYSLYNMIIGLLDRHDGNEKINIDRYLKQVKWKTFRNQLGNRILQFYQGKIDEERVLEDIGNEKAKAYFFIGAKYELEKKWKEAEKWYNMAIELQTDEFERLLALSRVGRFSFKLNNETFKRSETYISSRSLVGSKTHKKYPVSNLFDEKIETAWAYKDLYNASEYVIIEFPLEFLVSGFTIVNGFSKSRQLFLENKRVKTLEMSFSDGTSQIISIKDTMNKQRFPINKKTSYIKFTIKETYPGTKFNDVCISELMLF